MNGKDFILSLRKTRQHLHRSKTRIAVRQDASSETESAANAMEATDNGLSLSTQTILDDWKNLWPKIIEIWFRVAYQTDAELPDNVNAIGFVNEEEHEQLQANCKQ